MDTRGLKGCYFLCLSAAATAEWCYFLCLSADDNKAINAYQNDVTFYAYQPPPLPNDVTIDAYQPNDIAINAYQVCKKNEIGFSQNDLSIGVRSVWLEFLLSPKTNTFPFRFISLMWRDSKPKLLDCIAQKKVLWPAETCGRKIMQISRHVTVCLQKGPNGDRSVE